MQNLDAKLTSVVFSLTVSVRNGNISESMLDAVEQFLKLMGSTTEGRAYVGPSKKGFQVRLPLCCGLGDLMLFARSRCLYMLDQPASRSCGAECLLVKRDGCTVS